MELKVLGDTGIRLSSIGLGTAALGGERSRGNWGIPDKRRANAVIHSALDNGINWVDTSPYYGCGEAETLVGEVAAERRHEVFIATRCGMVSEGREMLFDAHLLRREVENSLRRLQTDAVDLVMIQQPSSDADSLLAAWEALVDLQAEGKTRTIGLANANFAQVKACHVWHRVDVIQPEYNILTREIESEHLISYCQHQQIGILAHSPLASGLLSGSFEPAFLHIRDARRTQMRFTEPQLSRTMDFVERLRPIAERHNKTVGQLALAWVLRHGSQVFTAVGARSVGQIEQNLAGADWMLSIDDLRDIDRALVESGVC